MERKIEKRKCKLWQNLLLILLLIITRQGWAQTPVYDKELLRTAINNGESVLLMNDINIDYELTISKSLTLDLGGNTLKREQSTGDIICVKCTAGIIRIKNGNIITKQNKKAFGGYGTGLDVSGANVIIESCTISGYTNSSSSKDATGIQFFNGNLYIVSGDLVGTGARNFGKNYAIWSDGTTINNFLKGSYLKKDGNVVSNVNVDKIEGSVTVSPISYSITYHLGEGNSTTSSYVTSYKALDIFDGTIGPLQGVTRNGYQFNYWICSDGTTTKYITSSSELPYPYVTRDSHTITLTADWSPILYTIKYDMAGGTNSSSNITSYDITKGAFNLVNPESRVGYEFLGWYDEGNNKITSITYEQVKNAVDKTYIITARWKPIDYTVNFTVETAIGKTLTYTVETTDISLPEPLVIPSGQEFAGWQDEQGRKITSLPVSKPTSLTLSPIWKDKSYYAYFYDENGSPLSDLTKSYIAKEGLSSAQFPPYSKEGYIFEGWFKESDNNHSTPISSIPIGTAQDVKLYAYTTPVRYSLTYDLKGGTYSGNNPVSYTFSEKVELPTDKNVSNLGYAFKGWFLHADFSGSELVEAPITGGTISNGGRNVAFTVYAKWEKIDYTIVFKTDGGIPVDNASYNVTDGIPADKMPKTSKAGYKFLGWYKGDTKIEKIDPGHEELELIAKWELISYSITYNLNGGTNPADAVTSYTCEKKEILPRPTRNNYQFSNWYEDSDCTVGPIAEIIKNTTGNKVFYARWEPEKYTISFNTNGGSEIADQTYTYGEETGFARKTRKTNYTFAGWYKDAALTDFFGDKISSTSSGSFTLYAKWVLAVYVIEYDCYYGTNPLNVETSYTINDEVVLPTPTRENFTFAGWYDNDYLKGEVQTKITKGSFGDKKFYATWTRANAISFTKPENGKIVITQGDKELKAGGRVGAGVSLTIAATTTSTGYVLQNLLIGGTSYTSSPQTISMPSEGGLVISATFTENSAIAAASAPEIILTPSGVDKFPKGENVKAQLRKTDEATTLYYLLDGAPEKAYSGEFLIESPKDTILLKAIARKEGYRDGIASRYIVFDNGKITLTFDLPLGVKATNPTGGDVVSATVAGGSFEFKLTVDQSYYTNLDSMVVAANDSTIKAGASGIYTLTNCPSDVTVTVSGLKAKTSTVTLQQTENGKISFTDGAEETTATVDYGATVSITAVADEDFKFLQWNTGSQSNPLKLTVTKDTTISARFISDYKAYAITLPQLEGVTVKPFSGFTTEVKKDGTFKFYLQFANGYHEDNLVVRANGEELTKNKGGYAIYHINKNISISVEGIGRDAMTLKVPEHVTAKVVETMADVTKQGVYGETVVLLHAEAPAGKVFTKWTDGKTDNPRLSTALDAAQLIPLFDDKGDESYAKVILNQTAGAGITGVNANLDAVKSGDVVQLKVVLLPAYSQSEVVLTADDQKVSPEVSLRAATDTKTYVYKLPVQKDGVTIKVSGLKLNTYDVTMVQMDGGTVSVSPAGKVTHGDKIQLKAQPASGMLFVKWWDGNTLNPYPYTVTSDTEVKAYFLGAESTVDNESIQKEENAQIAVSGQTLSVTVAEESMLYIWDYKGSLFRNLKIPAGGYTLILPAGGYLVKVGDMGARKIIIR